MTCLPQRATAPVMLAYQTRGEGPHLVLLLHGFLGSGRNLGGLVRVWAPDAPQLRFVQADLLGHGKSPPLPPGADLRTMAKAALALARQLAPGAPIWVVGHSIGGRVALVMRHLDPETVARVSLLDIGPGPTRGLPSGRITELLLQAPLQAPNREALAAYFAQRGMSEALTAWLLMNLERHPDGYRWRVDREALSQFRRDTQDQDLWSMVQAHAPHLQCLRGGDSAYVSDADVARMAGMGLEVHTVPGAGHFIHVDAPQAVLQQLTKAPHPAQVTLP